MKAFALLAAILVPAYSAPANPPTVEELWSHLFTNGPIIWQAPSNKLPKSFWIYKKMPRVFSTTTISNAIILASFQDKGFPKPSRYRTTLWANHIDGEPMPPNFSIWLEQGQISFSLGDRAPESQEEIWTNQNAVERAWNCLSQLGVDRTQFVKTNVAGSGAWGIFFPRQIDGIQFYDESEGFSFQQFGKEGKIRCFWLALPNLKREKQGQSANPQQIIACIRAHKAFEMPNGEEENYFDRLKILASAKKLTITKIMPYYSEGIFGEVPTNDVPPEFVTPIAELEAVADFGNSNATVRLLSPILSSEVSRLLGK
jgi:hypothetical protein